MRKRFIGFAENDKNEPHGEMNGCALSIYARDTKEFHSGVWPVLTNQSMT